MQKKPQHIEYGLAKIAFGLYLVGEIRQVSGKDFPTETDVKKILLRLNPACTAAELQIARQVSRYCQTNKDYLREAREETLDKVGSALNTGIKDFATFRKKINPLLKAYKYYSNYVHAAENYLKALNIGGSDSAKKKFCRLFACDNKTRLYYAMISYHFGEVDKELPAVSFGAESDMRTQRILTELFDVFDLPSPQYLPEANFFEQLNTQATKTTFIAIGLFGNRLTEWMGNNNYLVPTLQILPAEKCIKLQGKIYKPCREEGTDYALFCKATLNPATTVFVIGGIEGFGTQRIGEYLQNEWPAVQALAEGHDTITLLFKTAKDVTLTDKVTTQA